MHNVPKSQKNVINIQHADNVLYISCQCFPWSWIPITGMACTYSWPQRSGDICARVAGPRASSYNCVNHWMQLLQSFCNKCWYDCLVTCKWTSQLRQSSLVCSNLSDNRTTAICQWRDHYAMMVNDLHNQYNGDRWETGLQRLCTSQCQWGEGTPDIPGHSDMYLTDHPGDANMSFCRATLSDIIQTFKMVEYIYVLWWGFGRGFRFYHVYHYLGR